MLKKGIILVIIFCFIGASVVPSIMGYNKKIEKIECILDENEILNIKNDDKDALIKQFIESGIIPKNDWMEQDKILPSEGSSEDRFGISVSIDGDYAIIGAVGNDGNVDGSGSAYVFKRSGVTWTQEEKLHASDGAPYDNFGCSVSINGDYAIIGANVDDDNGRDSGSAYVFKRSGVTWTQEDKLLASDGADDDYFGCSVSINGDYAIIGVKSDDDNGRDSGSAYVFKRSGVTWTQEDKLLASDGADYNRFGYSVSINGDYAIIGVKSDDDNGRDSGSAYVFKRSGVTWTQEDKLLASDGSASDSFGISVSINGDYAIIGASEDNDNGVESGSAYVFKRSGVTWTQEDKLLASDGAAHDAFGWSVSIDGDYAIIGAIFDGDNGFWSGSAYVFVKSGENQPPNTPQITGPDSGIVGEEYNYTFNSVDPDDYFVKFYIEWGDGDEWTEFLGSGEDITISHVWNEKNDYIIRAKAKDINGAESEWGSLEISMPRNRAIQRPFLQFLEQLPRLYQLLLRVLQL